MRRVGPVLALALLLAACDKETKTVIPPERNFPPEIRLVSVQENRILAAQMVQVNCGARDRDNDPLGYRWTATGGSFPFGNNNSIVRWKSPPEWQPQTLSVAVTDLIDTTYADLDVTIVGVAPPGALEFSNGTRLVDLSWQACIDEGRDAWSGYEVFGSARSLIGLPSDSLEPYRLTQSPITRHQFRVLDVTPGRKVYYQIRSRRDYEGVMEISVDGPEIDTASRLRGISDNPLFEIESARGAMGLHLPDGSVERLDPGQIDRIDLYLGTENPNDEAGALRLKSPSLLAYRDPAWAGRVSGIRTIDGDWLDPIAPEEGYLQEVPVETGRVYAIRTFEGHYGKLQISQVPGAPPERRIWFQWAWQPAQGYPRY